MGNHHLAVICDRRTVRCQDSHCRPCHNALHCPSSAVTITKGYSKFSRNCRPDRSKEVELCHDGPPSPEPTRLKVLNEIGEDCRSAQMMEKHDLCRDPVSGHYDLFDVIRPFRRRCIRQVAVPLQIGSLCLQRWYGMRLRCRIDCLPLTNEHMVQGVRCNNVLNRPQTVDRSPKLTGKCCRRPDEQRPVCQSNYDHSRWIGKSGDGDSRAIDRPYFFTELL